MNKNDVYIEKIIDNGMEFEGIAKIDNIPVFVPNAIKGEKTKIRILKVNKNFAFGKVEEIIDKSKYRIEPICSSYYKCGGCDAMHIDYNKTLDMKMEAVKNTLKKQGINDSLIQSINGMETPYYYRNKVQYPVRKQNGKTIMGMFSKRSHNIIQIDKCYIENNEIDKVANTLFNLLLENGFIGYDEELNTGDIKNIMIRIGINTEDIMCVIVASRDIKNRIAKTDIIDKLVKQYSNIKSIVINVNNSKTNNILSNNNICIYGDEYITDKIGKYIFKISANSFFQVNTIQAEKLYSILKEKLELTKKENVLELYSGVGSIGIFLSDMAKKVYGIEIVEESVKSAKENVKLNNIQNVEYICDDATKAISKIKEDYDVVIIDPPRKGLDSNCIELLKKIKPKTIGYISCNPATLARDLKLLSTDYNIQSIDLVDMFPWTSHVECCVLLGLNKSN